MSGPTTPHVRWFADLGLTDQDEVGGKSAPLGELVANLSSAGVRVPDGFATTATAFRRFLPADSLAAKIDGLLAELDAEDTRRLVEVGAQIRAAVLEQPFANDLGGGDPCGLHGAVAAQRVDHADRRGSDGDRDFLLVDETGRS